MEYITAKQTINKLKQGRVTDISEAYFSQLVSAGAIPNHTIPGKKRKLYLYDEVKKALADIQDPTRNPQREANSSKRATEAEKKLMIKKKEIEERYQKTKELQNLTSETLHLQTGFSGKKIEHIEKELYDAHQWNYPLIFLIDKQREAFKILPLDAINIDLVAYELLKHTVEMMITIDDFQEIIEEIREE